MFALASRNFSFFFFSSRRRHTRCYRDWSSDVCSSDLPSELERHLGHEAERAAARGLRKPNFVALELGERVGGESFRAELSLDRVDEVVAERTKIPDMNASPENREQGAGVSEEEALLPLDPYEVQVPVVVSRRELAEGKLAAAE